MVLGIWQVIVGIAALVEDELATARPSPGSEDLVASEMTDYRATGTPR